jgi:hypothetical protein
MQQMGHHITLTQLWLKVTKVTQERAIPFENGILGVQKGYAPTTLLSSMKNVVGLWHAQLWRFYDLELWQVWCISKSKRWYPCACQDCIKNSKFDYFTSKIVVVCIVLHQHVRHFNP